MSEPVEANLDEQLDIASKELRAAQIVHTKAKEKARLKETIAQYRRETNALLADALAPAAMPMDEGL